LCPFLMTLLYSFIHPSIYPSIHSHKYLLNTCRSSTAGTAVSNPLLGQM
jgi:hypothetical protein